MQLRRLADSADCKSPTRSCHTYAAYTPVDDVAVIAGHNFVGYAYVRDLHAYAQTCTAKQMTAGLSDREQ